MLLARLDALGLRPEAAVMQNQNRMIIHKEAALQVEAVVLSNPLQKFFQRIQTSLRMEKKNNLEMMT